MTARVRSFAARPPPSYQAVPQGRQFVPHLQLLLDRTLESPGGDARVFLFFVFHGMCLGGYGPKLTCTICNSRRRQHDDRRPQKSAHQGALKLLSSEWRVRLSRWIDADSRPPAVAPATPPSVAGSLPTAATTPRPRPEASISSSSRARIPAVLPEPRPAKLLQQPRSSLPLRVGLSPPDVRLRRSSPGSNGVPPLPAALLPAPLGLPPAAFFFFLQPFLGRSCTFSLHGLVLSSTISSGSIGLDPESVASCGAPSCLARVSSRGPLLRDRQPSGSVPLSSFLLITLAPAMLQASP